MKTEIDRELGKQITNCLHDKDETKKRNFAFVHGAKQSALVIDKKRIGAGEIKEAQKTAESTKVIKGLCFGQEDNDGKRVVFLVNKTDDSLERRLRQAIKETAGITCKVEVREVAEDQLDEVHDKSGDEVKVGKEPTQEQKDIANKARYKKMLALVQGKIGTLTGSDDANLRDKGRELLPRIAPLMNRVEQLVAENLPEDQRQYKQALEALVKINKTIGPVRINEFAPSGEFDKLLRRARAVLKKIALTASTAPMLTEGARHIRDAALMARLLQFSEGITALKQLLQTLDPIDVRMRSATKLMMQLYELTEPEFPLVEITGYNEQYDAALGLPLTEVAAGLTQVEERMRNSRIDYDRFKEAAKRTRQLLDANRDALGQAKMNEFEQLYRTALERAQAVHFNTGYDAMTKLDAQIRGTLRLPEAPKPMEQTNEVRKLKIAMNVQNLRRAMEPLRGVKSDVIVGIETVLQKLLTSGGNFDEVEEKLAEVQALVQKKLLETKVRTPVLGRSRLRQQRVKLEPGGEESRQTTEQWAREIEEGNILGRMTVGDPLGDPGGFGTVHNLNPQGPNLPPLIIKIPTQGNEQSLVDEARIYTQVGDHPNLVKCLGMRQVDGRNGLVMEKVQGRSMGGYMRKLNEKLEQNEVSHEEYWGTVQHTVRGMMEGLKHLHEKGFGHNDLKPQNIMIDEVTGMVKVIDLGALNTLGTRIEGVDNSLYRAPEDFRQHRSSPQTDSFGAGATVYSALNEKRQFHFGDEQGMEGGFFNRLEKIILAYGAIDSDEAAIGLEQGDLPIEDDPKRTLNRGKFTEFMNLLLHPDPKKRLTPKEALEHPFLREPIMEEDKVKEVIQRLGE